MFTEKGFICRGRALHTGSGNLAPNFISAFTVLAWNLGWLGGMKAPPKVHLSVT